MKKLIFVGLIALVILSIISIRSQQKLDYELNTKINALTTEIRYTDESIEEQNRTIQTLQTQIAETRLQKAEIILEYEKWQNRNQDLENLLN